MLTLFQNLYSVEREAKETNLNADQRKAMCEVKAMPVIGEIGIWIKDNYQKFIPQSPMGKAVAYFHSRFNYIMRNRLDGRLEIDNNLIENAIRLVALGRKNYLFAGSHQGGKRRAMIYSFMATCKLNGVEPFDWLRDMLSRLPDHPVKRRKELAPIKN